MPRARILPAWRAVDTRALPTHGLPPRAIAQQVGRGLE